MEIMDMCSTLIMVVSFTNMSKLTVHFKYAQLTVCQLQHHKAVLKKRLTENQNIS